MNQTAPRFGMLVVKAVAKVRARIRQADPAVVEAWKWRGVPVWYHDGMICTGETYKSVVKLTFAKGAALKDRAPAGAFCRRCRAPRRESASA